MHTFLECTVELGYLGVLKWIMVAKQICKPQARNRLIIIIILWRTCRWCLYLDATSCIFTISCRISNLHIRFQKLHPYHFPLKESVVVATFDFFPLLSKWHFSETLTSLRRCGYHLKSALEQETWGMWRGKSCRQQQQQQRNQLKLWKTGDNLRLGKWTDWSVGFYDMS